MLEAAKGPETCGAVQAKDEHVLLMTLECTVFNPADPKKSMVAVVFIDPGAQRSFITTAAAEKLGLKPVGHEDCSLTSFGQQAPKNYSLDRVRIGFLGTGGQRLMFSANK